VGVVVYDGGSVDGLNQGVHAGWLADPRGGDKLATVSSGFRGNTTQTTVEAVEADAYVEPPKLAFSRWSLRIDGSTR